MNSTVFFCIAGVCWFKMALWQFILLCVSAIAFLFAVIWLAWWLSQNWDDVCETVSESIDTVSYAITDYITAPLYELFTGI